VDGLWATKNGQHAIARPFHSTSRGKTTKLKWSEISTFQN